MLFIHHDGAGAFVSSIRSGGQLGSQNIDIIGPVIFTVLFFFIITPITLRLLTKMITAIANLGSRAWDAHSVSRGTWN